MRGLLARIGLLLALATLGGCGGGGGGLFATVPPPVEFAGSRVGGINELPTAGTYTGTLKIDRVDCHYGSKADGWTVVVSAEIAGPVEAEAVVGSDGAIVLRDKMGSANTFEGTLKVSNDPLEADPTATLRAPDATTAVYPYVLRNGEPRTLLIRAHGKIQGAGTRDQRFVRYTFDLNAPG